MYKRKTTLAGGLSFFLLLSAREVQVVVFAAEEFLGKLGYDMRIVVLA